MSNMVFTTSFSQTIAINLDGTLYNNIVKKVLFDFDKKFSKLISPNFFGSII